MSAGWFVRFGGLLGWFGGSGLSSARAVRRPAADDADELLDEFILVADQPGQRDGGGRRIGDRPVDEVASTIGASDRLRHVQHRLTDTSQIQARRRSVSEHGFVGQFGQAHLLEDSHRVLLRYPGHRRFLVETNQVQVRLLDRQPDETQIDNSGVQDLPLFGGFDLNQLQPSAAEPLAPGGAPFGQRDPGHVADAQSGSLGGWGIAHLCRLAGGPRDRLPGVSQLMKPSTAATKLGIYLPAAPIEFQNSPITRDELDALRADPPEWLAELRRNGPFPKEVIAQKLGVSRSGLARGGITEGLTADQVGELMANPPYWLQHERDVYREVVAEKARLKAKAAEA